VTYASGKTAADSEDLDEEGTDDVKRDAFGVVGRVGIAGVSDARFLAALIRTLD